MITEFNNASILLTGLQNTIDTVTQENISQKKEIITRTIGTIAECLKLD